MIGEAHHYGVTVSDMDTALEFYGDTLGMDVDDTLSFDDEAFSRFVGVEGADVDIVFLSAGGCAVELLEYDDAGENANEGVSNDDIGASHFCLAVDDVESLHERLRGDAEFLAPPQTLSNGSKVTYVFDPDGNVVELLEE